MYSIACLRYTQRSLYDMFRFCVIDEMGGKRLFVCSNREAKTFSTKKKLSAYWALSSESIIRRINLFSLRHSSTEKISQQLTKIKTRELKNISSLKSLKHFETWTRFENLSRLNVWELLVRLKTHWKVIESRGEFRSRNGNSSRASPLYVIQKFPRNDIERPANAAQNRWK